jgi:hypothetical protein
MAIYDRELRKTAAWHCDLFPTSAAKYPQVDQRITRCQEEKSTDKKFIDGHGSNKKLGTKCPKKRWVCLLFKKTLQSSVMFNTS